MLDYLREEDSKYKTATSIFLEAMTSEREKKGSKLSVARKRFQHEIVQLQKKRHKENAERQTTKASATSDSATESARTSKRDRSDGIADTPPATPKNRKLIQGPLNFEGGTEAKKDDTTMTTSQSSPTLTTMLALASEPPPEQNQAGLGNSLDTPNVTQ